MHLKVYTGLKTVQRIVPTEISKLGVQLCLRSQRCANIRDEPNQATCGGRQLRLYSGLSPVQDLRFLDFWSFWSFRNLSLIWVSKPHRVCWVHVEPLPLESLELRWSSFDGNGSGIPIAWAVLISLRFSKCYWRRHSATTAVASYFPACYEVCTQHRTNNKTKM